MENDGSKIAEVDGGNKEMLSAINSARQSIKHFLEAFFAPNGSQRDAARLTSKKTLQPCRNPFPPFVVLVEADQTTQPRSIQEKSDVPLCDR